MAVALAQAWANAKGHRLQSLAVCLTLASAAFLGVLGIGGQATSAGAWRQLWERTHGADVWLYLDGSKVDGATVDRVLDGEAAVAHHAPAEAMVQLPMDVPLPGFDAPVVRGWPTDPLARPLVVEGRVPAPGELDAIALDRNMADAAHLRVGQTIDIPVGALSIPIRVTGTTLSAETCPYPLCSPTAVWVAPGAIERMGLLTPANTHLVSYAVAVDLHGRGDSSSAAFVESVRSHLPPGSLRIVGPSTSIARYNTFTFGFQATILAVFAFLAILAAALLIAVCVGAAVRVDARRVALLKAVGFTGTQLRATYVAEYGALALVGALVGALGAGLSLPRLLASPLRAYDAAAPPIVGLGSVITVMVVVGAAATVAAVAARRAVRLDVVAALRGAEAGRVGASPPPRWIPPPLAAALVGLRATPARTASLTGGLLLLGVVGGAGLLLGSGFRQFLSDPEVSAYTSTDLLVTAPMTTDVAGTQQMLAHDPDITGLISSRYYRATVAGRPVGEPPKSLRIMELSGERIPQAMVEGRVPSARGEVMVGFGLARTDHVKTGEQMTIDVGGRRSEVRITGLVRDFNNLGQNIVTTDPTLVGDERPLYIDHNVRLRAGADPASVGRRLQRDGRGTFNVLVVGENLLPASIRSIRTTAAMLTLVLAGLTALGVLNSVVLSTSERRRELALLKAIGMTGSQVVQTVVAGAASLAVLAGLVGTPLSVVLTQRLLNTSMTSTGIGPFPLHKPATLLLVPLGVVAVAVAGSAVPALRSARRAVVPELRQD